MNSIRTRIFFSSVLAVTLCVGSVLYSSDWATGRADSQGSGATADELPSELRQLWKVQLDGLGFDAGPIIAEGRVFANDHDGRVIAVDLQSGKELWKKQFFADEKGEVETGFVAAPSFSEKMLFAADFDGVLHALDVETGDERWRFASDNQITGSPVFYEDSVVFTSEDGNLYRLEKKSGELVWKYETEQPILCGAALAKDVTFLGGCDEHLHLVDLKTGERIGDPVKIGPTQSTPSVIGDRVFIPTHSGHIFQYELKDRKLVEKWVFFDESLSDEFRTSLAVKDGLVIATGRNKRVFALDIETKESKWVSRLRKRADASPVIAGASAVVAAADGRIVRFDLKTGEEKIIDEVKGAFLGSPAVADGKLVLTNDRGDILCYGE